MSLASWSEAVCNREVLARQRARLVGQTYPQKAEEARRRPQEATGLGPRTAEGPALEREPVEEEGETATSRLQPEGDRRISTSKGMPAVGRLPLALVRSPLGGRDPRALNVYRGLACEPQRGSAPCAT
jgi:hypothetical protein